MAIKRLDATTQARPTNKRKRASTTPDSGEAAHFAAAMSRWLRSISTSELIKSGGDLVRLIDRELAPPALDKIENRENPTPSELRLLAEDISQRRPRATAIDRRMCWLTDALGFDDVEYAILGLFARCVVFDGWRELAGLGSRSYNDTPNARSVAKLLGLPIGSVEQRLSTNAPLLITGLVEVDRDSEYTASRLLRRLVRASAETPDEVLHCLMPTSETCALDWQDFEHLGEMRELTESILSARQPVSIILFGEPGTGKTEFARAVTERVGLGAIFAGLTDDFGLEPTRAERLTHLMLLRSLCARRENQIIVVDEADDVLEFGGRKNGSKQWINRLVEAPRVPTIWIVNDLDNLDKAVLRRMALAVKFERPSLQTRQRVAHRAAKLQNAVLTETEAHEIATLQAAPAIVASGMRIASLAGGGADLAKIAIKSVIKTLGNTPNSERCTAEVYDPDLSSADTDLTKLVARLKVAPMQGWSLLLTGPSGTGKSAFGRHLAEQLGLEIEERRCSDLMSPFVGQTEINIAAAFAKAAERGAMLLIDEADSFLHRRDGAQRSWEINQVNEMLVQMEHLQVPFVATTNLVENLDPASQRRFTMRVAFKTMTDAQARRLFRVHFSIDWPSGISIHIGQTPGDFGVVAHRAALLGEDDPVVLVRWLHDEIEARGGGARQPVGFCLPRPIEPLFHENGPAGWAA